MSAMTVVTSRSDFEKLIALRLREAKNLIDLGDWDGAYYLAGYVVEYAFNLHYYSLGESGELSREEPR